MLKKSLLSLAVSASLVGLTGCNISSTTDNSGSLPQVQEDNANSVGSVLTDRSGKLYPLFNPGASVVPLGSDFIFADAADSDGTANVGATGGNAIFEALNDLDGGISVLAPIDLTISGAVDPATVIAGQTVHLVKLPNASDAASLALPTGLDASSVDALDVASIAPLFDSSVVASNLPSIIGMQPVAGTDYEVRVIDQTLVDLETPANSVFGTDNVIRILPKKPLDAKTKYIVVLTGGITDTNGDALVGSGSYEYAQKVSSSELFTSLLAPVHDAVQAWETLASAIITQGGANLAPLAGGIVLSSAHTTVDPHTVLKSMAYPGYWAPSVITNNTIADAVITAGGIDASGVPDVAKIPTAIGVANAALTAPNPNLGNATAYEHPRARTFEIIPNIGGAGVDQLSMTAVTGGELTEDVLVSQGAIELPQYTAAFDGADATTFADIWSANTTVGAVLDGALGQPAGTTPPSDIVNDGESATYNVTYRYPFAAQSHTEVAPILMIEPAGACGAKPVGGWPVVIMIHGFQGDRTNALLNGGKIAEDSCQAVVAIDAPTHGVVPAFANGTDDTAGYAGLGVDFESTATPFADAVSAAVTDLGEANTILDSLKERHQNFKLSGTSIAPFDYTNVVGESGTLFIRLDNFQKTRDNLRQATMDLLNLNASLSALDIDGDGTAGDLDADNVSVVGHSLGAIIGTTFVAVNNDATVQAGNPNLPKIQKVVLATPGGNLTKVMENSVVLRTDVLNGLQASGLTQGLDVFESFMKVFQATVDNGDPMNFISDLADGGVSETPTLVVAMVGDGSAGSSDTVVPINAVGATLADGTTELVETAYHPLAGLDPMVDLLGAENVVDTPTDDKLVAKYNDGDHGTFSSANVINVYGEMLDQTVDFLTSAEDPIVVSTGDVDGSVLVSDGL